MLLASIVCLGSTTAVRSTPANPPTSRSDSAIRSKSPFLLVPDQIVPPSISFTPSHAAFTRYSFPLGGFSDTQATQNGGEQDDNANESPSYLKPALFIGGALATTGILIRTDQRTYDLLHRWRMTSDPLEDVSPVITNLGDGRASMAIFGGFLAYSFIGKDNQAFQAGKIGLESFLVAGIATQILKHTFGRQRPSTSTQNGGRWNGAYLLLNQGSGKRGGYASFDAFPSGHTATIFAAATTLAEVYHDSPWVSYASYSVASSVAISRVMERAHWLSDCFVGGIIGYFSTKLVLHYNHMDKPVVVVPTYDGTQMGLALNIGL